jgi:hypothetical protein
MCAATKGMALWSKERLKNQDVLKPLASNQWHIQSWKLVIYLKAIPIKIYRIQIESKVRGMIVFSCLAEPGSIFSFWVYGILVFFSR